MLRIGEGTACAFNEGENGWGTAAFLAMDIQRGANLFAILAGAGSRFVPRPPATAAIDKWSRNPKSLQDQMVLDAAKNGAGKPIIRNLNDPKFKGMDKYSYGETSAAGRRSEVHYVKNPITGELMDFKFKLHSELYK